MATKWKRAASDDAIPSPPSKKRSAIICDVTDLSDEAAVDAELASSNDLLQEEETSQNRKFLTFRILRRVIYVCCIFGNLANWEAG